MNYTLIFSKNSQIDNRNSPAGSDLTPMEYTLMMIVEEKGEGAIPGFTAGSTTIATNGEDRGLTNNLFFHCLIEHCLTSVAPQSHKLFLFSFSMQNCLSLQREEKTPLLSEPTSTQSIIPHWYSVYNIQGCVR